MRAGSEADSSANHDVVRRLACLQSGNTLHVYYGSPVAW
jgi:hypothetical protein